MSQDARPTFHALPRALPFWLSLVFVPLVLAAAREGGWWLISVPVFTICVVSLGDVLAGLNRANPDPSTRESALFWHRLVTLVWLPIQLVLIFGALGTVGAGDHLNGFEQCLLMASVGAVAGTIGINYAHELIHQRPRWERALGEMLLISVLYGHFKSEHIMVHHRYVGTPRDPVTARFRESFYRYFPRVLKGQIRSAWQAERARLAKRGRGPFHVSNPFWRYAIGGALMLALAAIAAGWAGIALYLLMAFVAVGQLELINYIEHYGLTRKHLGDGRYEPPGPHHSWNAEHRITNYLLINLQRHSDHHYKPDRRFPLLQTYAPSDAPQLPHGYPLMATLALFPRLFRRRMNPLVKEWRQRHYPEITDWRPYTKGTNPMPR